MRITLILLVILPFISYSQNNQLELNYENAIKLADVPLECIDKEYPNKLSQVLNGDEDLKSPHVLHPLFYGCFDWHSSVHGHWLLTKMLNDYPATNLSRNIAERWDKRFTLLSVLREVNFFATKNNKWFERTYGWTWLLKLQMALNTNKHPNAKYWALALEPLSKLIVDKYKSFLPNLIYPIRHGKHPNTAFGLSFALDYARQVKDTSLSNLIESRAKDYYLNDKKGPLKWEPSGSDFLSPCFEEANLMAEVLSEKEFKLWIKQFLPQLLKKNFTLEPAKVLDRTDGQLVHLDGLNFSRAWCLYRLAKHLPKQKDNMVKIADNHINASINEVIGSDYMGSHWLASFLVYALEMRTELLQPKKVIKENLTY